MRTFATGRATLRKPFGLSAGRKLGEVGDLIGGLIGMSSGGGGSGRSSGGRGKSSGGGTQLFAYKNNTFIEGAKNLK